MKHTTAHPICEDTATRQLKSIPEHWHIRRLKFVANIVAGQSPPSEIVTDYDGSFPFLQGNAEFGTTTPTPRFSCQTPNKRAQRGDILLSVRAPVGAINTADQDYGIGRGLCAISPTRHINENFLHYTLQVTKISLSNVATGSTYDAVTVGQVGDIPTPLPSPSEQAAIVRYLNHANELINRYISAKERLITLLEEQRQAIVHQILIRGFERDRCLKDSGIPWAGHIPANWEVRRLRTVADISTGGKDTINAVAEGKYPFFVRSQTVERIDTWSFDGEAVLIAGDGVGVGKVFHYINGKFDYHQRVYKFSQFTDISGRLFYHYLKAMLPFVTSQGTAKSTVDSLRLPMLQNLPIVVPPPHAQQSLTRQLDRIDTEVNQATEIASGQINLIDEYRTRLISDVVTGQIDVRDAVVELPKA